MFGNLLPALPLVTGYIILPTAHLFRVPREIWLISAYDLSDLPAIFSLGKELSDKPLSMLSALRAMYDPRSVALKEYLPAMKDTVGSSGSFSWAQSGYVPCLFHCVQAVLH